MKELHSLDPKEVSLVPRGANKKRFLVMKADEQSQVDATAKVDVTLMGRISKVIKGLMGQPDESGEQGKELSQPAQTALRAVARIVAPHKDEITDAHLDAVQSEVGISPGQDGGSEGDAAEGSDEGADSVKPEDMKAAKENAEKAYKETLEKAGYKKFPSAEEAMKAAAKPADDQSEEDDEEEDVSKSAQPILKEDGSINLDAVPAELRPALEVIAKAQVAADARAKAAEDKSAGLEKVVKEQGEKARRAELVQKAAAFTHLKQEDVLKTLELADKSSPEELERVSKMFEGQNKLISESKVFETIGSAQTQAGGSDSYAKIEKAAEGLVLKSGGKITQEQAITNLLETPEGQKLYAEHQASRKDGI